MYNTKNKKNFPSWLKKFICIFCSIALVVGLLPRVSNIDIAFGEDDGSQNATEEVAESSQDAQDDQGKTEIIEINEASNAPQAEAVDTLNADTGLSAQASNGATKTDKKVIKKLIKVGLKIVEKAVEATVEEIKSATATGAIDIGTDGQSTDYYINEYTFANEDGSANWNPSFNYGYRVHGDVTITVKDGINLTLNTVGKDEYCDPAIQVYGEGNSVRICPGNDSDAASIEGTAVLNLYGGAASAAIGGRTGAVWQTATGENITIDGCTINAYAGENAAAIGGGFNGDGGYITINGGVINAHGGHFGAGIGSGQSGSLGMHCATVEPDWYKHDDSTKGGHDINITGGVVYAYGGDEGAGIGGGRDCDGHDISITGGTVYAYGGSPNLSSVDGGPGIGCGTNNGGDMPNAYNIYIGGDANVTAIGNTESAGIGSTESRWAFGILIEGNCNVCATAGNKAAAVGGGKYGRANALRLAGGHVILNKDRACDDSFTGFGSGYMSDACDIEVRGTTEVEAYGYKGAAIGSGDWAWCKNVTVLESASVYAEQLATSDNGAAIGAGHNGKIYSGHWVTVKNSGEGHKLRVQALTNGKGIAIGPCKSGYVCDYETDVDAGLYIYSPDDSKEGNLVHDGKRQANYKDDLSKWQQLVVKTPDVEPTLKLTKKTVEVPTVGYESTTNFSVDGSYLPLSLTGYQIKWFKDAAGTEETTAPVYLQQNINGENPSLFDLYTCPDKNLADYGITPAGKYYIGVQTTYNGKVYTSNIVEYDINKTDVNVTSGSAQKIYDGTPLTCESITQEPVVIAKKYSEPNAFEISGDVVEEGYKFASKTEVGNWDNTFDCRIKTQYNAGNYKINEIYGTLEIIDGKTLVSINSENYSTKYDGKEHSLTFNVTGKNGTDITETFKTAEWKYWSSESGKAGSFTENEDNPTQKDAGKLYVYAVATYNGTSFTSPTYTLEVTKRNITFTSASDTKEYDGTALTRSSESDVTASGDGLIGSDEASFNFDPEPSITTVGSVTNKFSAKINGEVDPTNYKVTTSFGTLVVNKKSVPITIYTNSHSKKYDATALTVPTNEYSCTKDVIEEDEGDSLSVSLYHAQEASALEYDPAINVGSYTNSILKYEVKNNEDDRTNCYTFTEPSCGVLKIDPRCITLTSETKLFVYDGKSHIANNVTVSGDELVSGQEPYCPDSEFTEVKEVLQSPVDNVFTYSDNGDFLCRNYSVTQVYGKLMVVDKIGIVGQNTSVYYNGAEQTAPATTIGTIPEYAEVTYQTSTDGETWTPTGNEGKDLPSLKDAGTLYIKAHVQQGQQSADTEYTFTVLPRQIKITTGSASKQYDSTPLTCSDYNVSGMGFADGEGFNDTATKTTGTQTDVGYSPNYVEWSFKEGTEAKNYNVEEEHGKLTVTKNESPIKIYTDSNTQAYAGYPLTDGGYSVEWIQSVEDAKLFGDDTLIVCPTGSITDVGSASNTCTYQVVRGGKDITDYYTFASPVLGTLTVTARNIIIATNSADKVYDATPLTNTTYVENGDGFVAGEGMIVNVDGSRTDAGTSKNTATYTLNAGTKAANYFVTVEPGTLTVEKRKVTVTSGSAISTLSAVPEGGVKNPTITYSDEFIKGHVDLTAIGVRKASEGIGTTSNTINYTWKAGSNSSNFLITEFLGLLKIIDDSDSEVFAPDASFMYDGNGHNTTFSTSIPGDVKTSYKIDDVEVPEGTDPASKMINVKKNGEQVDSYEVDLTVTSADETKSASCSYKVKITPRSLQLTAGSASKIYDNKALTCSDVLIGGDGFANDTEKTDAKVSANGSVVDVENSPATNEATYTESGTFKINNYSITTQSGTLTIKKRTAIVVPKPLGAVPGQLGDADLADSLASLPTDNLVANTLRAELTDAERDPVLYDGNKHTQEQMINIGKGEASVPAIPNTGFVEGQGVDYDDYTEALDAGVYVNKYTTSAWSSTDLNNYNFKAIYGIINISKRTVDLASPDDSKMYDGTPLTNDQIEISGDNFATGEGADFNVTGSQTSVGTSENSYTYELKSNTSEQNYFITTSQGTLEVTNSNLLTIVVPESIECVYDGNPHGEPAHAYIDGQEVEDCVYYSLDGGINSNINYPTITEPGEIEVTVHAVMSGYESPYGNYKIKVYQNSPDNPAEDNNNLYLGGSLSTGDPIFKVLLAIFGVLFVSILPFVVKRKRIKYKS